MKAIRLLLFWVLLVSGLALAQDQDTKKVWNLHQADIKQVIEQISQETGKNFLIDDKVKGRISIISQTAIDADELYQVFLASLHVLNLTAVDGQGVTKIVPENAGRNFGLPIYGAEKSQDMAVAVLPVHHVSAPALVPVLRQLLATQSAHLAAYPGSNMLIVADRASSIERFAEIVARVDVGDNSELEMITLKNAIAQEVVAMLNDLLGGRGSNDNQLALTVAADTRANAVLLSGPQEKRLKARALVASLDTAAPTEGNTEVIFLKYQKASGLVDIIGNVMQAYFADGKSAQRSQQSLGVAPTSQFNTKRNQGLDQKVGGRLTVERSQDVGLVMGSFGIKSDSNLNALIITAPPMLMRNIKDILAKLDIRRAQVLVEAIVVELTEEMNNEFGIDWRVFGDATGGFSSLGQSTIPFNTTTNKTGPLGALQQGLTVGFIPSGNIHALLRALESKVESNILATPTLVALDNTQASIFVGETRRVAKADTVDLSSKSTERRTFEDKKVGLSLAIVPQITVDRAVQLQIEQKVDSVLPTASANSGEFITTNRAIETNVIVNDEDILVLGGLIRHSEDTTTVRLPVLGHLPLIGKLFTTKRDINKKTNLMVFIKPKIMRNDFDGVQVTGEKYNYIRDKYMVNNYPEAVQRQLVEVNPGLAPYENRYMAKLPHPFGA